MRLRTALTVLLLVFVPLTGHAAKKKKPLTLEVTPASTGLPRVTLTASDEPLSEIADRLGKKLGTTIDVSAAARVFRVTVDLDQQPLDLTLRELAPQAYLDGVLSGGNGKMEIRSIHLRMAGEPAPPVTELEQRASEVMMFFGNTEDPAIDPLEGKLEVTYRNDRLRVFARSQALSVVASRIADALGISLELIGDSRELVDVSLNDATLEQVMKALTPRSEAVPARRPGHVPRHAGAARRSGAVRAGEAESGTDKAESGTDQAESGIGETEPLTGGVSAAGGGTSRCSAAARAPETALRRVRAMRGPRAFLPPAGALRRRSRSRCR